MTTFNNIQHQDGNDNELVDCTLIDFSENVMLWRTAEGLSNALVLYLLLVEIIA